MVNSVGQLTYAQSMGDRNYVLLSVYSTFGVRTH
jgi:hypothetical protein